MLDKKMLYLAVGGMALVAVATVTAGLIVRKQANKLRRNVRTISRGVYNFDTALQLLSGAAAEEECEGSVCC